MKPRLLLVARGRYSFPLDDALRRKFDALGEEFDLRVLSSSAGGEPNGDVRFAVARPVRPRMLDGAAFYLTLPGRVVRQLRAFKPDAVLAQGAHETAAVLLARRLARVPTRVILDLHGDWRAPTRLYGSPLRRLLGPLGDVIARKAVRRADVVRTISDYTTSLVRELGVEPGGVFPAYMDLSPFTERAVEPLPPQPRALFVGVLERYKNVDGLVDAWRTAAPHTAGATLQLVGRGSMTEVVEQLVRDLPEQTEWTPLLSGEGVSEALDRATFLVLPSRSEGMGRVIVEAFLRGRPVLGSRVGGIPDLVEDGVNGMLVEPGDRQALADALVLLLSDRELAERLALGARASVDRWLQTPRLYAQRVRDLVDSAQS